MISCTDFIPAYSELFRFLEKKGGKEAVNGFWEHISDTFLTNLRDLAEREGIRGCWEYWSHTLNEEAADFTMDLDEDAGTFSITMHHCPSKGRLLELSHVEPYHDYCGHCAVLYSRVLEPLGFRYTMDMSEVDRAKCSVVITRKDRPGA